MEKSRDAAIGVIESEGVEAADALTRRLLSAAANVATSRD